MIHPPIVAFVIGVVLSEVYQWAAYWKKNTDKPALSYWKMGLPHAIGNTSGDVIVAVLWAYGGLDVLLVKGAGFIPGSDAWAASGVPYTPEIGIMLGFGVDLFSDNLTYLVRKFIASRWPGAAGMQDQPVTPPAGV